MKGCEPIRFAAFFLERKLTEPANRIGKCHKHGETVFVQSGKMSNGNAAYKCRECRKINARKNRKSNPASQQRTHKRRLEKRIGIVELFGGECVACGYRKSTAALHFHHRDGTKKSFQIACREMWRPHAEIVAEASKCDLICANCHCELHFVDGTMGPKKRLNVAISAHQERNT